jgi:hypothetical protein
MKRFLTACFIAVAFSGVVAHAGEPFTVTTLQGKCYQRCEVVSVTPQCLHVRHSRGLARLSFTELPTTLRQRFNYSPSAAAAHAKQLAETKAQEQAALAAKRHAERERARAEKAQTAHARGHDRAYTGQQGYVSDPYAQPVYGLDGLLTQPLGHSLRYPQGHNYLHRGGYNSLQHGPHWFGPTRSQLQFGGIASPPASVQCAPHVPHVIQRGPIVPLPGKVVRIH